MHSWKRDWRTDLGLRLFGIASCGVSCLAINTLTRLRLPDGHIPPDILAFALAAAGFLCASAGAVLLFLGRHIFDEVEISPRWRLTQPIEKKANRSEPQDNNHWHR